jgi:hypothetical protein
MHRRVLRACELPGRLAAQRRFVRRRLQGYVNARLKNSPALATPGPDAGSAQILTGCDPARSVLQPRRPGVACAAAALIETPIPRMMSGPKR